MRRKSKSEDKVSPAISVAEESAKASGPTRGISPALLLKQVRASAPFVFSLDEAPEFLDPLIRVDVALSRQEEFDLDHVGYFQLCLAAHHATVASFLPTDVDNQIRFKLWDPSLDSAVARAMASVVEASVAWDSRAVSTRWIPSPIDDDVLSGHLGEWFSTAVAAYGALRRRDTELARYLLELIGAEVTRQSDIFTALLRQGDGIGLLKASTLIAHNLGDLDRVADMWSMPESDPLRRFCRAGHPEGNFPALALAGELNKAHMATYNHRHFALREPKGLRRSASLLLPVSPFLDKWGYDVATSSHLQPEDVGEVVQALLHGYERLEDAGYVRALAGIEQGFQGGMTRLAEYIPARAMRTLKAGTLRVQCSVPRQRFEEAWAKKALAFCRGKL